MSIHTLVFFVSSVCVVIINYGLLSVILAPFASIFGAIRHIANARVGPTTLEFSNMPKTHFHPEEWKPSTFDSP